MKAVRVHRFGPPSEVAVFETLPDPPKPADGEVTVRIQACPIHPADLLLLEGSYGVRPRLPFVPGSEAAGIVEAVGPGVLGLSQGDLVILLPGANNWRQLATLSARQILKAPPGLTVEEAAQLKANPATADLLLGCAGIEPTDAWVIVNAANSAVGRTIAAISPDYRVRCLAIVRRPDAAVPGAAAILIDDGTERVERLVERVIDATGGTRPRLALDAIGGGATERLGATLCDNGTIICYGLLSGEPCRLAASDVVFRGISLRGFWLADWFKRAEPSAVDGLFARLARLAASGRLNLPVEARYSLDQIGPALAHAARAHRDGKILLTP